MTMREMRKARQMTQAQLAKNAPEPLLNSSRRNAVSGSGDRPVRSEAASTALPKPCGASLGCVTAGSGSVALGTESSAPAGRASKALRSATAIRVHVTQSMICSIERGIRSPSVLLAKRIGAVLGFDWTLLFNDMDGESDNAPKPAQSAVSGSAAPQLAQGQAGRRASRGDCYGKGN